ncbi:MAG: hypothetical protein DMG16_25465 [Acidobacteria bacterium]|nr:MAG: hypothetical protein DMG16_25465 [Acidobacteriota bacterium]
MKFRVPDAMKGHTLWVSDDRHPPTEAILRCSIVFPEMKTLSCGCESVLNGNALIGSDSGTDSGRPGRANGFTNGGGFGTPNQGRPRVAGNNGFVLPS